jgi:hypothetical protein
MRIDDFCVDPLFVAEISAASPVEGEEKKAKKLKTFVIGKARGGDFPFFFFFKSRKRMAKFSEGK